MAKKAPAKRKPNLIEQAAPQLAELSKRMDAARKSTKRKPRAKNPVEPKPVDYDIDALDRHFESITWQPWFFGGVRAAALIVCGAVAGVWVSGGIAIGPGLVPADSVSAVFDTQESAFRSLSGERAKALRAGEIKSEANSAAWMSSRFIPQAEAAWIVLLTEEAKAFGGEQWTAEKEAAWIERYVR
jgi:hypothetical protein